MIREPFRFRETFAAILAETPAHAAAAKEGMINARMTLEGYIARDLFFASTFFPYEPDTDEPLIRHMATAAAKAGCRTHGDRCGCHCICRDRGHDRSRCPVRSNR